MRTLLAFLILAVVLPSCRRGYPRPDRADMFYAYDSVGGAFVPLDREWADVRTDIRNGYLYTYTFLGRPGGCRLPAGRVYTFLYREKGQLVANFDLVRIGRAGGRRYAHMLNGPGSSWRDSLPLGRDDRIPVGLTYVTGEPVIIRAGEYLARGEYAFVSRMDTGPLEGPDSAECFIFRVE